MEKIYDAIVQEDYEAVEKHLKDLEKWDIYQQNIFLSYSKSDQMAHRLNKIFKLIHEEDKSEKSISNSDEEYDSTMTENDAIKKHMSGDKKLEKAGILMLNSFKYNIQNLNYDRAAYISFEIANLIHEKFKDAFPKTVRTKSHNLKENSKLCYQVYEMKTSAIEFVEMSVSEMKSDELKDKDNLSIKNSILSAQVAKPAAETDIFQCSKCKQRKCTYSQLQTRSCDEPMTTFVFCTVCGNRWKF